MWRVALLETKAKRILNKEIDEGKRETALRMLQDGVLLIEKIAKYSGLAMKKWRNSQSFRQYRAVKLSAKVSEKGGKG